MPLDVIDYKGWRIDVMAHAGGWKAFIYSPGATMSELTVPNGPDKDAVIAEAKSYIDGQP